MRATMHSGKRGNIKHNSHDPKTKNALWDKSRSKDNYFYTDVENCNDPAKAELEIYKDLFGKTLEYQNVKHADNRQYKRIRDMETWKETKQHRPSETILQIGDKDNNANDEILWRCVSKFISWKCEKFSNNYKLISMTCHVDESTPHVHVVEVWYYHDEQGNPHPGIKGAMREIGIPLPHPEKPEGKDNYRKATLDAQLREKWLEICVEQCKKHGIEIETEPDKTRKIGHMGTKQYKAYTQALEQLQDEYKQLSNDLQKQQEMLINQLKEQQNALEEQIKENEELIIAGKKYKAMQRERIRKAETLSSNVSQRSSTFFDFSK